MWSLQIVFKAVWNFQKLHKISKILRKSTTFSDFAVRVLRMVGWLLAEIIFYPPKERTRVKLYSTTFEVLCFANKNQAFLLRNSIWLFESTQIQYHILVFHKDKIIIYLKQTTKTVKILSKYLKFWSIYGEKVMIFWIERTSCRSCTGVIGAAKLNVHRNDHNSVSFSNFKNTFFKLFEK